MSESKICPTCTKAITGQAAVVDGKTYHTDCFVCTGCKASLAGKKFFKKESGPYCETCNIEKFAPDCFGCKKKIPGRHLIIEDK